MKRYRAIRLSVAFFLILFLNVVNFNAHGQDCSSHQPKAADKTIDIFIKSYHKDFKWLFYSLKSIEKYARNVNKIIIVIPENEVKLFKLKLPLNAELFPVAEKGNGYLFQQYIKLSAHHFSSADFIMFMDSDCVFTKEIDLKSLIENGNPRILMTRYEDLCDSQGKPLTPWRKPTEKALGRTVEYEFMRRNFLLYKRSTLVNFEHWFPYNLKDYILSQVTFSEFNVIGAYAYFFEHDEYDFVDTRDWEFEEGFGKQYWSLSGLTAQEREELDSLLTPDSFPNP